MTAVSLSPLLAALVLAQRDARGVEKNSENTFHGYKYASAESVLRETKACLSAHGLALVPSTCALTPNGTRLEADAKGVARDVPQLYVHRVWMLVHESGAVLTIEQVPWPICPEKGRPLDKAVASADTASLGYLLRDVLLLPRVEPGTDLDDDSRDEPAVPDVLMAGDAHYDAISRGLTAAGLVGPGRDEYVAGIVGHQQGDLSRDQALAVIQALTTRVKGAP